MQNNSQAQPTTNGISTIEATSAKQSSATNAKEKEEKPKLMISHGKPNFKISSNSMNSKVSMQKIENTTSDELIGTLRKRSKYVEILEETDSIDKSDDVGKYVPNEQRNGSKMGATSVPKSPVSPPVFYKAAVKNYNSVSNQISSTESNNEIKRTIKRLKSVELMEQIEKSVDEKTELNDIQKKIQNLKTVEVHKTYSSANKSPEPKNVSETDCFQSSPIMPRRAHLFKQQQNLVNPKITSPPINHGTSNFKAKPVTSFSRDLQLTPNRYPEKIPVKKSLEPEPVFFSDIKFAINSNGEVVRS